MGRTVRDGLRLAAEQEQFVEMARAFAAFAAEEIRPRGHAVDEADTESPLDVWEKASKLGLTTFMIPERCILNGQETWISDAPYAESFVIFATVDPSLRSRGVTAFVIPWSAEGLTVGPPFQKMGQGAIVNAEVFLCDPAAALHPAWGRFEPGVLGVVSQRGQVRLEIAGLAGASPGVSRFVSVGDQADVTALDALCDLVSHETTRVVGVYLESFPPGIVEAFSALRAAGKPVVLLTVGQSEAAASAALSHTGALTSAMDVVDAACRRVGAVRVRTPAALVDVARQVAWRRPGGPRVGIVADSGGQGAITADGAVSYGLPVPVLSSVDGLPSAATRRNPIDLAGAAERDLWNYARAVEVSLRGGEVDSVVLSGSFGSYRADAASLAAAELEVARRIGVLAEETGIPVVVHSSRAASGMLTWLEANRVPVHDPIERAIGALGGAVWPASSSPGTVGAASGPELSVLPGKMKSGDPLGGDPCVSVPEGACVEPMNVEPMNVEPAHIVSAVAEVACKPGYLDAREVLDFGDFPRAHAVTTPADILATTPQPPCVLKVDRLTHRSEHDGVRVGITDPQAAFEEMRARLGSGTYVLEEMDTRPHTVELIIGAGGIHAEPCRDTAIEPAPVTAVAAESMLDRLTTASLLDGWRGAPVIPSAGTLNDTSGRRVA